MRTLSNRMIGLLLAATAVTPIAAQAQDAPDHHEGERPGRGDRGGPPPTGGIIRGEQTQHNMEHAQRPQQQPQAQAPQQAPQPMQRPQAVAPAAQPNHMGQRGDREDRGQRQFGRDRDERPAAAAAPNQPVNQSDRRNWQDNRNDPRRDDRRDWNEGRRDAGNGRPDDRRDWNNGRPDDHRGWNNDRRDDRREWTRDWRSDRRYGWQDYRNSNRSIFRVPRYVAPRGGYNYRRWSPGFRIDPWFYGSSYWINDPFYYRLPPAYGDYRWIRYFDDVYLVDIRTGLVVDVIYSFFWH